MAAAEDRRSELAQPSSAGADVVEEARSWRGRADDATERAAQRRRSGDPGRWRRHAGAGRGRLDGRRHRGRLPLPAGPSARAAPGDPRLQGRGLQVERDHLPRAGRGGLGQSEPRRRLFRGVGRRRREHARGARRARDQGRPLLHLADAQRLGRDHGQHQRALVQGSSVRQVRLRPAGVQSRDPGRMRSRSRCRTRRAVY